MNRTKADWRRELLAARAAIPEAERRQANLAMLAHVRALASFHAARTVVGYLPIGAEADVVALLIEAAATGRSVFVPEHGSSADPSCWVAWRDGATTGERVDAASLQYPVLVLVPGVGFDHSCVRLGRGLGFYDRALSALRRSGPTRAVGMAFEPQIVPRLPKDSWDETVDLVVSEARVIEFEGGKRLREVSACS